MTVSRLRTELTDEELLWYAAYYTLKNEREEEASNKMRKRQLLVEGETKSPFSLMRIRGAAQIRIKLNDSNTGLQQPLKKPPEGGFLKTRTCYGDGLSR